jgi:hypothetical protein
VAFENWIKTFEPGKRTFILKHKDVDVLEITIGVNGEICAFGDIFNIDHLPLGTSSKNNPNLQILNEWWKNRAIPASRDRLNELLESLGLVFPWELLDKSLGLSLSDQYWICPTTDDLKWGDVNFFQNGFSEDVGNILFDKAKTTSKKAINLMSPDNTTNGVLKRNGKLLMVSII